jgi:hypothetical protein
MTLARDIAKQLATADQQTLREPSLTRFNLVWATAEKAVNMALGNSPQS